jgi:hypothetical protein
MKNWQRRKRKWSCHTLSYLPAIYEISGSHSGVVDNAGRLGCEAVSWGEEIPAFRRFKFSSDYSTLKMEKP